jgi:hypothetical protein
MDLFGSWFYSQFTVSEIQILISLSWIFNLFSQFQNVWKLVFGYRKEESIIGWVFITVLQVHIGTHTKIIAYFCQQYPCSILLDVIKEFFGIFFVIKVQYVRLFDWIFLVYFRSKIVHKHIFNNYSFVNGEKDGLTVVVLNCQEFWVSK